MTTTAMVMVIHGPTKIKVQIRRDILDNEQVAKEFITERVHGRTRTYPNFYCEQKVLTVEIELQGQSEFEMRAHAEWARKFLNRALQVECSIRYQENLDSL